MSSSNRDNLQTTAFQNADGKIAVVVMNMTGKAISYLLWMNGKAAKMESLPHSISTLMF
ncbi:MAG: glycoside hydrolase family 30 beta sandwich domain-containing protein [Puia sp.]